MDTHDKTTRLWRSKLLHVLHVLMHVTNRTHFKLACCCFLAKQRDRRFNVKADLHDEHIIFRQYSSWRV